MTLSVLARQVMAQLELRRVLARQHRNEKELHESETRGRLAFDAAELGAWEAVPGTGQVYGDVRARRLMGHAVDSAMSFDDYLAHVDPRDREQFAAAIAATIADAGDRRLDIEYRVQPKSEETRWLRSIAQLIKLPGERRRLIGTVRDVSDDKAADERRRLLTNELQHRVKNTLGVVQGIVNQSLRTVATPAEASAAIGTRLQTLACAHDLLTQTIWTAAPLKSVIEGSVIVHIADRARVLTSGPEVNLNARAALALSMAFHELFTNAVKYGALSNETGTIAVSWKIDTAPDCLRTFDMLWHEQGGPQVAQPLKKGFGSRLTGSSLAGDLGGRGIVDYAPEGVCWKLATTLAALAEEARAL